MSINEGEDIHDARQELASQRRARGPLAHPPQERRLVAPVGVEPAVWVTGHNLEELLVEPGLLSWRVGPQGIALFHSAGLDDHTEQVDELAVWIALQVEVYPRGTDGQLRGALHIDLLVAEGKG